MREMRKWEWCLAIAGVLLLPFFFYFVWRVPLDHPHRVRDVVFSLGIIYGGLIVPITSIYRIYLDWRYSRMKGSEAEERQ